MKLIAYVSPKGGGKDSCASIAKENGIVAGKIPFAGPLKRMCSEAFSIPLSVFEDAVLKENEDTVYVLTPTRLGCILDLMDAYIPMDTAEYRILARHLVEFIGVGVQSPRQLLQYVGTEVIREWRPDWHCAAAFSPHHLAQLDVVAGATYAVTDCRFMNEYEYLNSHHDVSFHYVSRPEAEAVLATATHSSELGVLALKAIIGSIIENNGTLGDLKKRVLEAQNA